MKPESVKTKQKSVLFIRNYSLLFSGKIISQLGDQIYTFALSWYILEVTKSGIQMASFLVIDTSVVAIVSLFGGLIADRLNRKYIMVWMDTIRGIVVILSAVLLYNHMLQIWMIYVSAVFLGTCGAIFSPASSAIIPNIVDKDQLTEATSLDQFVFSFCAAAGLLISGILYNLIGVFVIFLINAVSYLISGFLESCINLPYNKPINYIKNISFIHEFNKVINELYEGFLYVKKNSLIFNLTLLNAMFLLIVYPVIMVFSPYLFNVILKATPFQLAITQSGGWIGLIFGSIIAPIFISRLKLRNSIFWGLLVYSICFIIGAPILLPQIQPHINNWSMTVFFAIGGMFLSIGVTFFMISTNVIFQNYTSDEYRGRFWGLQRSIGAFIMPVGYLAGGFLVQYVWISLLFIGIALLMFILNLWAINLKEIKEGPV